MESSVYFETRSPLKVPNKGLSLSVWEDDELVGRLEIGRATLRWFSKGAKKPTRKVTWSQFVDLLSK